MEQMEVAAMDSSYSFPELQATRISNTDMLLPAKQGNLDLVKELDLKGNDLETSNEEGINPLMSAAMGGQYEICQWLFFRGVNMNSKDMYGQNAYTHAVQSGNHKLITFLKECGLNKSPPTIQ